MPRKSLSIFLTTTCLLGLLGSFQASANDLEKKVNEIYGKDNEEIFEPCDFQNRPKILELSRALEAHEKEIGEFSDGPAPSAQTSWVQLGRFQFSKATMGPPLKSEWESETLNWQQIFKLYETIKNKPVNQDWIRLQGAIYDQLTDDERRISSAEFLGVSRTSGPMLLGIRSVVDKCASDKNCTNPPLNSEQKAFLSTSGMFRFFFLAFDSSEVNAVTKRKALGNFQYQIAHYAEAFTLQPYPGAQVQGKTLIVPVDVSAFADGAMKVIAWLEKSWNTDKEYRLRIRPVNASPSLFVIKVSEDEDGRSAVHRNPPVMQLYNHESMRTLAHEFGHILGFRDTYYTVWDKKSCSYIVESNPGDLMSDQSTGSVLPEHWQLLKKLYWKK